MLRIGTAAIGVTPHLLCGMPGIWVLWFRSRHLHNLSSSPSLINKPDYLVEFTREAEPWCPLQRITSGPASHMRGVAGLDKLRLEAGSDAISEPWL